MRYPSTDTRREIIPDKSRCHQLEEMQSDLQACLKTEEDSGDSCVPVLSGKTYSVTLRPDQPFHCSETGIKFQVRSTATIKYELEYGKEYMAQIEKSEYEIVGPLFKIEDPDGAVSEVSLPHYVSLDHLRGEKAPIKWGHFKDGKITLKTPDKIEPSYIVLKNPTFSCVAVLLGRLPFWRMRKPYPINVKVLIYFRVVCPESLEHKHYRIHLYLIPREHPEIQELDEWKLKNGFTRIDKPHQTTDKVYTKTHYSVTGKDMEVSPESLELIIHEKLKNAPFLEIDVAGNTTDIYLSLTPKDKDKAVWKRKFTRGEILELTLYRKDPASKKHFVDKYRAELISKVTPVERILDHLKERNLLTDETYQTVRKKETSQAQMRELYSHLPSMGEKGKEVLYDILEETIPQLIKELDRKRSGS